MSNRSTIIEKISSSSDNDDDIDSFDLETDKLKQEQQVTFSREKLSFKGRREKKLFEQRIKFEHEVFNYIVKEETTFEKELEQNDLSRPCNCKSLCNFRPLVKRLIKGFDNLYSKYESLYADYYVLYMENNIVPVKRQKSIKYSRSIEKYYKNNSNNYSDPFPIIVIPELDKNENNKEALDKDTFDFHANLYEEEFIGKNEEFLNKPKVTNKKLRKTLAGVQVTKSHQPFIVKCVNRIYEFLFGECVCACLHCTDRDNLDLYRTAIKLLYDEYRELYFNVLALFYADEIQAVNDDHKLVVVSEKYQEIRMKTYLYFEHIYNNLIET